MNFMINTLEDHAVIDSDNFSKTQRYNGSFFIRNAQRKLRIGSGDSFCCFTGNKNAEYSSEKIELLSTGNVLDTITSEVDKLNDKEKALNEYRKKRKLSPLRFYNHRIKFNKAEPFKENKYLDDYPYSLVKIYKRYINPVVHFSKTLTELPTVDFETLKKERIFVDRTLFGRLINAMPYENRLQFMLYAVEEFGKADLREVPFSKAFPLLKDFVGSGIIQSGKYLVKSQELIIKSGIYDNYYQVGFAEESELEKINNDEDQSPYDNILEQSELFKNLFAIEDNFETLFSTVGMRVSSEDKKIFDRLFSKRNWPVDLNTDNR